MPKSEYPLVKEGIYQSEHLANFFVDRATKEDKPIDLLRLVKITYFGYGWVLSIMEQRLIEEEIEAWRLGPVIPSVYHAFKRFGREEITEFAPTIKFSGDSDNINIKEERYFAIKPDTKEGDILQVVWDFYKNMPTTEIMRRAHSRHGPWKQFYTKRENIAIKDTAIKKHFDSVLAEELKKLEQ